MDDPRTMEAQFRALADPTRLRILSGLARGEMQAGEIARTFPVSRPAISHHLRVLSEAGLIRMRRRAQSRLYSLDAGAVMRLRGRFDRFWDDALPNLKATIEADRRAKFAANRAAEPARPAGPKAERRAEGKGEAGAARRAEHSKRSAKRRTRHKGKPT